MSIRRLSISVPEDTEAAVRAAARQAGVPVSAWLTRVAENAVAEQAALADGLAALSEFEADHGPLDPDGVRRAREELAAVGVFAAQVRAATG